MGYFGVPSPPQVLGGLGPHRRTPWQPSKPPGREMLVAAPLARHAGA